MFYKDPYGLGVKVILGINKKKKKEEEEQIHIGQMLNVKSLSLLLAQSSVCGKDDHK